jgi:hypothetical protein
LFTNNVETFLSQAFQDEALKKQLLLAESDSEIMEIAHQAGYKFEQSQLDECCEQTASTRSERFFSDLFYPDNVKRKTRVSELASDCHNITTQLAIDAERFKQELDSVNSTFRSLFQNINVSSSQYTVNKHNIHGWTLESIDIVNYYVTFSGEPFLALEKAAASYLLRTGKISQNEFNRLVNISTWLESVIDFAVSLWPVSAAIYGAQQRTKMRKAIAELVSLRIEFKKSQNLNTRRINSLTSLIGALNDLEALGYYTEESLRRVAEQKLQHFQQQVWAVSNTDVRSELALLDRNRGSWTNEDP